MELTSLRTVLLVAHHGSFAAAARVLSVDPSSVSRAVAAVEASLGLRLFHRTTRTLRPTEEGRHYLRRIAPLVEEFDLAREEARQIRQAPAGTLRLTASVAFAHHVILPLLKGFQTAYPDIRVELLATDAALDLAGEGIDLAIRLGRLPTGDVVVTRLFRTRYRVVASPAYVAEAGILEKPEDLAGRDCLRFALPEFRSHWRFQRTGQSIEEIPVDGRLVMASAVSLRQAALDGMGPALLADWLVGPDILAGRLLDLFPAVECAATDFDTAAWAIYPSRRYRPAKTKAMIDFLRHHAAHAPADAMVAGCR